MKSSEKIYRKEGKHYVEIGHAWRGFPADGVWLVTGKTNSKTCIMQMKDLKSVHLPSYARLMLEADRAIKHMREKIEKQDGWISPNEMYQAFAEAITEGHEPFDQEKDEQRVIDNL